MIKSKNITIVLIVIGLMLTQFAFGQKHREKFAFQFENKTLRGLIESPTDKNASAIVIIIPGSGKTDFVKGNWYSELRDKFVQAGLAVCLWDKMGCGDSEGEFDNQQPVENSAQEAFSAIQEIKKNDEYKNLKIGFWGISRGGFICPLIYELYPFDFWISVSGTDDKESFGYLLKSNLMIYGKSEKEASVLHKSWMNGHKVFCEGGSFEEFYQATLPLMKDTLCQELFGFSLDITEEDKELYYSNQKKVVGFDKKSGLQIYVPNFKTTLSKINCPVLAIFGENDTQVDWKKTKTLYQETMGINPDSILTIRTLKNCNHNMQKCDTGGFGEDLKKYNWSACDNYYLIMTDWLKMIKIIE
jgi:alpha/beta superfamily hydrolase